MALNGTVVQSKPRVPRIELEKINPEVVESITEIVTECAKGETVFVSYTADVLKAAGLSGEEFLHECRSYAAQVTPKLAVSGSANKAGDVRVRIVVKDVSA
jgi:hypothetical protein